MTFTLLEVKEQITNATSEIKNQLRVLGYTIDATTRYSINISKDGKKEYIGLDFVAEQQSGTSRFRSTSNGKYRVYTTNINTGRNFRKKCFRSQKDGTMKVVEIAEYINEYFVNQQKIRKQAHKATITNNIHHTAHIKLAEQYGFHEYSSTVTHNSDGLQINLKGLTTEQTEQFIKLAKTLDISI